MVRGITIGKFYPPHKGHSFLIESALSQVNELTVIVCDHKRQRISGAKRAAWLQEIHPAIHIRVLPDIGADDDSVVWAKYTIESLGYAPDVVFTSESYGNEYAKHLGCRHVCVDPHRKNVPISATQIRRNPAQYWDFLEPCVRAYFAKRICVVGAESTGKTTLAKSLAAHYKTPWVPEYGRTYWEGKLTTESAGHWTTQEFAFIAQEQNTMEDQLARISNRILICDTDSFATSLWHERYLGFLSPEVARVCKGRGMDHYILTAIDTPFVQDGTRDGEHIREAMHARFVEELKANGKDFTMLSGDEQARLQAAIGICDEVLKEPSATWEVNYP
jgi:NadR type nicotinamide-nucleotide adenylyltransferase